MTAREAVQRRLNDLDWTTYRLGVECRKRGMSMAAIYEWLSGKRDITASGCDEILDILGMDVVAVRTPPSESPKPKRRNKARSRS